VVEYDSRYSLTGAVYPALAVRVKAAAPQRIRWSAAGDSAIVPRTAMAIRTIEWRRGGVVMIDQRLLPTRECIGCTATPRGGAGHQRHGHPRAPAIGVAAAMGIALGARTLKAGDPARDFERLCRTFARRDPRR